MQQNPLLYLNGAEVRALCHSLDSVSIAREALCLHAQGETVLPPEATLYWRNTLGETARSLALPGMVRGSFGAAGLKVINANPENISRGFPRASGLMLLFDEDCANVMAIMEGGYLSALRTASVSTLAIETLCRPGAETLAVIGAGVLAGAHLCLLARRMPSLCAVRLYDVSGARAEALIRETAELGLSIRAVSSAEEAVRGADVVIPCTTTTTGYLADDWLALGSLLVNVSLDDPLPEVVLDTDLLVVDSWALCADDSRRLLGRMYRSGALCAFDAPVGAPGRRVDAELGEILTGGKRGRTCDDERIVFNPFGMAIQDVSLAAEVYRVATAQAVGTLLPV
jgi:ornithine cyclodeaminase